MAEEEQASEKSYTIAVCLSAIFGMLGVQHFYMERWIEAILDLGMFFLAIYLFFVGEPVYAFIAFAIDGIHTFIVTIMLLTGSFRDGSGKLICYPGQKLKRGDAT